jgi:hypothetical protein
VIGRLRTRLTYANTVATLALFLALGGSSYAALSVTGKNVKNSSLTGKDVKNSSLGTKDVKNGALLAGDFKSGQLPQGAQGPQGPQGVQGLQGAQGDDGLQGPAGTARAYANVRALDCAVAPPNLCPIENSTGISQVTRPSLGLYCVRAPGISTLDVAAVGAPEFIGSAATAGAQTVQMARDEGGLCPNLSDFAVRTFQGITLTNDVAFNIVIP